MTATLEPPGTRPSPARTSPLTGTGTLLRLTLRRERIRLPMWIVITALVAVASAASFIALYPEPQDRELAGLAVDNAATVAIVGRRFGETYDIGIMIGHQYTLLLAIVAALMSIFTVVRHTRAEEENGLAELVSANVVGRHARTAATLIAVLGANVTLALALTLSLGPTDDPTITWAGSAALGAATAGAGLVFGGVAIVAVQLSQSARGASGLAALVLGAAFALRAVTDVAGSALLWASPLGWAQRVQPYHADDWRPVLLAVAAAATLTVIGVVLSTHRDLGASLRAQRPGPAEAAGSLAGPWGLLWRLHRGTLLGWAIALALVGATYGSVLDESATFLGDSGIDAVLPEGAEADATTLFASMMISLGALIAVVPAVQAVLRMRSEERQLRAGVLLATPLSRWRWAGTHLVMAVATAVVALAAFALGLGGGAMLGDSGAGFLGEVLLAAASYLPAVLVLVGLAVALVGVLPSFTGAVWLLLGYGVFARFFGELVDLPPAVQAVSPFYHVPFTPAEEVSAVPLLVLAGIAVALTAAGLAGLRRRDVERT